VSLYGARIMLLRSATRAERTEQRECNWPATLPSAHPLNQTNLLQARERYTLGVESSSTASRGPAEKSPFATGHAGRVPPCVRIVVTPIDQYGADD
jgi:hypothetical protein